MSNDEQQPSGRSRFIATSHLRRAGEDIDHDVTIRNLSSGGLMAEGNIHVRAGASVSITVPGIGWVEGSVAWVEENRFGIAFDRQIEFSVSGEPPDPISPQGKML